MEFNQRKTSRNVTFIKEETVYRIPKVKLFDDSALNNKLYELHKKLLTVAKNKNKSMEVGMLWNIITGECIIVRGTSNGISLSRNQNAVRMLQFKCKNSLVFMHNHPRNSNFSYKDFESFCDYDEIGAMTAVCNDGRIHAMRKEMGFNPELAIVEYNKHYEKCYSGIKYIVKNAPKLGLMYRCSVPRKEI